MVGLVSSAKLLVLVLGVGFLVFFLLSLFKKKVVPKFYLVLLVTITWCLQVLGKYEFYLFFFFTQIAVI